MGCSPRRLEGRKNGKRKGYGLARSVRNAVNTSALILQLPADQPIGSATHFGLPPTWVCVCVEAKYTVFFGICIPSLGSLSFEYYDGGTKNV